MIETVQPTISEKLNELASKIETKQHITGEVAQALRIIADAMRPCHDCGSKQGSDETLTIEGA